MMNNDLIVRKSSFSSDSSYFASISNEKPSLKPSKPDQTSYTFSLPVRSSRLTSVKLEVLTLKNKHNNLSKVYEFDEPKRITPASKETNQTSRQHRTHVVVVDQTPFSVLKSFKAQEQNEKSTNNVQVINSLRNHPYNNSIRPSAVVLPTATTEITTQTPSTPNLPPSPMQSATSEQQSLTETVKASSVSVQQSVNRNSSSNAILAHLKSISPNFKSIFVRPRNCKPIDSDTIMNKSKLHNKNVLNQTSQHESSLLPLLYGGSTNGAMLLNMLPNIKPKEIHLHSSVDDLLKKFANEDDIISRTINSSSIFKSISPTSMSTSSYSSSSITTSKKPIAILSNNNTNKNNNTNNKQSIYETALKQQQTSQPLLKPKWTCMICLSKHSTKLDICSICGSSKPSAQAESSHNMLVNSLIAQTSRQNTNVTTCSTSVSSSPSCSPSNKLFSSYLINELGLKHKLAANYRLNSPVSGYVDESSAFDLMDTTLSANSLMHRNPYIKKWTCIHCNYSNDSLKIVCLNCRWIKTSPVKLNEAETESNQTESLSKRAKTNEAPKEQITTTKDVPITQPEIAVTSSEHSSLCSSCKSPMNSAEKSKSANEQPSAPVVVAESPKKPSIFAAAASSNQNKWTCTICLVSNAESSEKCVCCMTIKPGSSHSSQKPSLPFAPTSISNIFEATKKNDNLLASNQVGTKWTCDTCLVQNNAINDKCACCMTPKLKDKANMSSKTSSQPLTGLFAAVKSTSKWTCDSCLVSNDAENLKCVCCSSDKPGAKSSSDNSDKKLTTVPTLLLSTENSLLKANEPKSTTIKFGSFTSETSSQIAPIKFGTSSSTSEPFKFGSSFGKSSSSTSDASALSVPHFGASTTESTGFKFGNLTAEKKTESPTTATATPALPTTFSFSSLTPETNKQTTAAPSFSFGPLASTSSITSTTTTPPTDATKPVFSFGGFSAKTDAASTKPEEAPTKMASSTSLFNFTPPSTNETTSAAKGTSSLFSFGTSSSKQDNIAKESSIFSTASSTQPASQFSLFAATQNASTAATQNILPSLNPPKSILSSSFGTTGFGTLNSPFSVTSNPIAAATTTAPIAASVTPAVSLASSATGSFFQLPPTTETNTGAPKFNLFGNASETPKIASASSTPGLFGTNLQTQIQQQSNTNPLSMFSNSNNMNTNSFNNNKNNLESNNSTPSFNFFGGSQTAANSATTTAAAPTTATPLFSTQTLTPSTTASSTSQPPSMFGSTTKNSFQFTPLSFNTPQSLPQSAPSSSNTFDSSKLTSNSAFSPLNFNPVINFSSSNPTGIIQFSGGGDQTSSTDISQRRIRKAARRGYK